MQFHKTAVARALDEIENGAPDARRVRVVFTAPLKQYILDRLHEDAVVVVDDTTEEFQQNDIFNGICASLVLVLAPPCVSRSVRACCNQVWPDAMLQCMRVVMCLSHQSGGGHEDALNESKQVLQDEVSSMLGPLQHALADHHAVAFVMCNRRVLAARTISRAWRSLVARRAVDALLEDPRAGGLHHVFHAHVVPRLLL